MTPLMTGLSYPVHATKMMAQTNAIIKLNTGPAATTEILAPTDLLWKESSALLLSLIHIYMIFYTPTTGAANISTFHAGVKD